MAGIPGFPCYRTVEETFATAEALVAAHPTLASWLDIGDSWEKLTPGGLPGYDMMVLRLTNSAIPGPKPKLISTAAIHAREYAPAELMTRFAESLVAQHGVDPDVTWMLDYNEVHLILQANPSAVTYCCGGPSLPPDAAAMRRPLLRHPAGLIAAAFGLVVSAVAAPKPSPVERSDGAEYRGAKVMPAAAVGAFSCAAASCHGGDSGKGAAGSDPSPP